MRSYGQYLMPVLVVASMVVGTRAWAGDHTLMRFPTMRGNSIVFEAHGNLWRVARDGGTAQRLTADSGFDLMPRFSPDGKWIAFTSSDQGNEDVYVIPANGGPAKRLTFHSDVVKRAPTRWGPDNMVVTWTPDSKQIVFLSRRAAWNSWYGRLFEVPVSGGLPVPLALDRGGLMTYSPDGNSIAYNRIFRNFRTWKRYDGGLAQDIYTYNFKSKVLKRITHWKGTDTAPMWVGNKIYFLSDRDQNRRENIWVYNLVKRTFREVTHFTNYDIDFPSLASDDSGIVFQQGGHLWVIDLPSEKLHMLHVSVPDDGTRTGPRYVDASKFIREYDTAHQTDYEISPNGKRTVFSARGDLITVPAKYGATRDLTNTSNADEDHPSWSPDGKMIAYTTDITGEQEIAVRGAEFGGQKILTHFKTGFFYTPIWSPGGKWLAFSDGNHRLWLLNVSSGEVRKVAQDPYGEIHDQSFSPDGRWLAYSMNRANQQRGIWLYNIASGRATEVSEPLNNDYAPVFSPNGKYLYFISSRHENPTLSESEFNIATLEMDGIYVATLQAATSSPFAPRSDEGNYTSKEPSKPSAWKPGASAPITIDLKGLMARAVPVPIPAADIESLDARGDKIFYETTAPSMISGPLPGQKTTMWVYDLKSRKAAEITAGFSSFSLSADGSKLLYKVGDSYEIVSATPKDKRGNQKPDKLNLSHMIVRVIPTEEWAEIFNNAWRLQRDLFVNPKMNGVNWPEVRAQYAKFLPLLGSREDLNYLLGEMQGSLANSHTYVGGGDKDDLTKQVSTALLGVDFELDPASGLYRFKKIYPGDNSRKGYRSPLTEPGVDVHAGDYLLAVNGRKLKAPTDPYSLFVGLTGEPVTLTIADRPEGRTRKVTVMPLKNELSVREKAWIDHNREVVDKLSGGRIGYVYMSDMEALGMDQFIRQFYGQLNKQALIMDDRFNGGGFIDQIVLERLRRILIGMSTNRERAAMPIPQQLINGPKVCLINHYSASDGDIFPYFFRKYGLGPLIGTRTWGGVRGIRGYWTFMDGGYITIPEASLYGRHSQWIIENHGVEPNIVVRTDPASLLAGHDAQLVAAVDYLMKELDRQPSQLPPPPPPLPAYPPKGMVPPAHF